MREYVIPITRSDHQGIDLIKIYAARKREAEKFIRKVYRSRAVRIVTLRTQEESLKIKALNWKKQGKGAEKFPTLEV